jgi:hypothetical protein
MKDFMNLVSKKFGAILAVEGFLLTMAIKQSEQAMEYSYMACVMAVIYCVMEMIDKRLNKGTDNGERITDVKNNNEKPA